MRPVVIAPAASFDIADAATAYDATRPGLGESFLKELRRVRTNIEQFPDGFHEVYPSVRRALMYRFPYGVLYRITPDAIQIVAVMPTRVDPMRIARRAGASVS